jgi:hypothetical protein
MHMILERFTYQGLYTWSNNKAIPTLEKLDRILVSKDCEGLFPTILVHKKPREFSDHNPLIIDFGSQNTCRSRDFRFELSWLKHDDFLPKVREIWLSPTRDSVSLDRVVFKLRKKIFFRGWGFNLAGCRKKRKQEIEKMIMEVEEKEECVPYQLN